MGSTISRSNKSDERSEVDPWWPIGTENFTLNQPNLRELRNFLRTNYSDSDLILENNFHENQNQTQNRSFVRVCTTTAEEEDQLSTSDSVSENRKDSLNIVDQSNKDSAVVNEIKSCYTSTKKEQTLEEFKEELRVKRMARQSAIADLRSEIADLRRQLNEEREINRKLLNGDNNVILVNDKESDNDNHDNATDLAEPEEISEDLKDSREAVAESEAAEAVADGDASSCRTKGLRSQLAESQLALQLANAENLSLTTELRVVRKHVASLKEVIVCSKQMIEIREEQVSQLKVKLRQIEESLAEREMRLLSDNLRQEYDKQLANIRNLRQLYEERARVSAAERENLLRQISIKKDELQAETEKTKNLEDRVSTLENEVQTSNQNLASLKTERDQYFYENKELKEEMAVINKLFSQMLTGFNGANNLDIDSLTMMLEENRTLLNEMTTKEMDSEGASLPKLLFDIVKQANTQEVNEDSSDNEGATGTVEIETEKVDSEVIKVPSAQEIIGNLPKVWRVLIELLNHHKIEKVDFKENGQSEDCYKSVQTPSGPKVELSVSKTYIKLKDLILEKKALQKETNKLKTLNSHLERRLHEQEKRLSTVSLELTKTWHLVGKMQRQHRQLHTHEQILRYQLQQKRRLLNELKEELEYCRRKWAAARAKNDESQIQYNDLRREFASRKLQDANNSAESGYSDGPASDEDDNEPIKKSVVSIKTREIFENSRKIERVQSESPQRPSNSGCSHVLRRENSAPPVAHFITELFQTTVNISPIENFQSVAETSVVSEDAAAMATATVARPPDKVAHASNSGTVPKQGVRLSRSKRRERNIKPNDKSETLEEMYLRLSGLGEDGESGSTSANNNNNNNNVNNHSGKIMQMENIDSDEKNVQRAARIQRLEEQCKSLIAEVIETSNCRDELNLQLSRFQSELAATEKKPIEPAQNVIECGEQVLETNTSDEEKGACALSTEISKPTGKACLTAREEEYTTKRAERLKRLEEESKQLMSRIKRTTERGEGMKSLLDHLHSKCLSSREGSVDSNTTNENVHDNDNSSTVSVPEPTQETISHYAECKTEMNDVQKTELNELKENKFENVKLTPEEEEYTRRRAERLKRLEEESKQLISKLSHASNRGTRISNQLDQLHSRYGSENDGSDEAASSITNPTSVPNPSSSLHSCHEDIDPTNPVAEEYVNNIQESPYDNDGLIDTIENVEMNANDTTTIEDSGQSQSSLLGNPLEEESNAFANSNESVQGDTQASSSDDVQSNEVHNKE